MYLYMLQNGYNEIMGEMCKNAEWITENGSDVSDEFIKYVTPLVQGSVNVPLGEDGLPVFVYRK